MGTNRDRRGGSKHKSRAKTVPSPNDIPRERILEMSDCIGGAARPHKDHVGIKKRLHNLWVIRAVKGILFACGNNIHGGFVVMQTSLHKLAYTPHHLRRIQLETSRSF